MERIKEKKQLLTDKEIRSILPVAGLTVCAILYWLSVQIPF